MLLSQRTTLTRDHTRVPTSGALVATKHIAPTVRPAGTDEENVGGRRPVARFDPLFSLWMELGCPGPPYTA